MRHRTSHVDTELMALLPEYRMGASTAQLAACLKRDPANVAIRLVALSNAGRVVCVTRQGPQKSKTWFAFEHDAQARRLQNESAHPWKAAYMPSQQVAAYKSAALPAAEPFFARPGYRTDSLSSGSAIERAYRGRVS